MYPTIKNKVLHWIAHITPYALILAVPVGFIIAILLQRVSYALYGLIVGIPTLAAAIIILKIQKRNSDFTGPCVLFPFDQQSLIRIFLIIFTTSFIVTLLSALKSTLFLILIVFLYCTILIQIFSKNPSPWVIITETILTLIILIYTTTLTSSYYFSWTDTIPHAFYATITSSTGHVLPPDLSEYSYFPLYHIWIASGSIITGFNSYTTIVFLTCPVYVISAIFVYFLFNRIIKNQQIALLACLLYSSSSIVVFYSTYVVTRTMAFIGFIILVYLLYNAKVTEIKNRGLIFKSLAIVISVYIILVHHVSTPMIFLLLIILFLCEWIVAQQKYIRIGFMLLMTALFTVYWFFFAYSFTSNVIFERLNPEKYEALSLILSPFQNTPLFASYVFLIHNLHMVIFLFFGIIGIFYIIHEKKSIYTPVFGLFALLTIVFYVPTPLQTLWQTFVLLNFDRFQLLIAPFMALMMAWGIWVVSKYLAQNKMPGKIISFIILLCFLIYSCSSVGLIQYNQYPSDRYSFNVDELIGFNFIQKNIPSDSHIFSDYYISRYFFYFFRSEIITNATSLSLNRGYFIIPKKQFITDGLRFSRGTSELDPEGWLYYYLPTNENICDFYLSLYSKNQIYSTNSLEVYVS